MQNKKVGYPYKYALMPIIEQAGWTKGVPGWEVGSIEKVVAYVAMECYLLQKTITYDNNGNFNEKYLIVFAKASHDFSTEVYPYDKMYGVNTTGVLVNYIFDTLEEAKSYEQEINNDLVKESCIYSKAAEKEILKQQTQETIFKYVNEAELRRNNPKVRSLRV